jgi:cysteine desulfurase/selenocysteine lyase
MLMTLDHIIDEFEGLDREDQSLYLLELGDDLPQLPEEARTDANRVHGCQSQVWLVTESSGTGEDAVMTIRADSDSNIVRGLIAILQAAYNGKTARQIVDFDILGVFQKLDLRQHISPQRRNGLRAMVDRIQVLAQLQLTSSGAEIASKNVSLRTRASVASGSPARREPRRLDPQQIRSQFPALCRPLPSGDFPIYLDSGASAQKPQVVIDKEREVEEQYFANAHRGTYQFGLRIDEELEDSRTTIARFINAPSENSVIFTPGTTVGLNMIASGWGRRHVQPGDEILTTLMEHHANFVPWQQLARERGATLKFIPLTADGMLDLKQLDRVLSPRTKLLTVTAMSNVLGTVNPIRELTHRAHQVGACVVVDAAQSVPHLPTDVLADDSDFLVFSGHKAYGPTGVGILYGKPERLEEMDPIIFGGHMISEVAIEQSRWSVAPAKFEAGTMPIVQAIALGTAIRWIEGVSLEAIHHHEWTLLRLMMDEMKQIPGLQIFGPEFPYRGGIVSFRIDGVHPEDLADVLDQKGIFTRHGHHCTMPLHTHLGVSATTRVSLAAYNTKSDIEALMAVLRHVRRTPDRSS